PVIKECAAIIVLQEISQVFHTIKGKMVIACA
ncbi:MAG: hypothetical protein EZS28_042950, partial [Streblomastix strix]